MHKTIVFPIPRHFFLFSFEFFSFLLSVLLNLLFFFHFFVSVSVFVLFCFVLFCSVLFCFFVFFCFFFTFYCQLFNLHIHLKNKTSDGRTNFCSTSSIWNLIQRRLLLNFKLKTSLLLKHHRHS